MGDIVNSKQSKNLNLGLFLLLLFHFDMWHFVKAQQSIILDSEENLKKNFTCCMVLALKENRYELSTGDWSMLQ